MNEEFERKKQWGCILEFFLSIFFPNTILELFTFYEGYCNEKLISSFKTCHLHTIFSEATDWVLIYRIPYGQFNSYNSVFSLSVSYIPFPKTPFVMDGALLKAA